MSAGAVSTRYAKALFGLALDQELLDEIHQDMVELARLIKESPEFARFVADPRVPPDKRGKTLSALFDGRAQALTLRFLAFLDEKDRLDRLPDICRELIRLYRDHRGILEVRITSAAPLSKSQVAEIDRRLHRKFGKTIQSTCCLDPALLGGFRIQAGDTIHDFSIATQLNVLQQKLIHA